MNEVQSLAAQVWPAITEDTRVEATTMKMTFADRMRAAEMKKQEEAAMRQALERGDIVHNPYKESLIMRQVGPHLMAYSETLDTLVVAFNETL